MNKAVTANIPLTAKYALARRVLAQWPGVDLRNGPQADLVVAGPGGHFLVEVKSHVSAAQAWQLVDRSRHGDMLFVLVADTISGSAQTILQNHGIGFGDARGNVHFDAPGVFIHIEGPKEAVGPASNRLRGKGSLIAQALLLDRDRSWSVTQMASVAGATPSSVHGVFVRLEQEGLIQQSGKGPRKVRRLVQPARLLDVLAEEHKDKKALNLRGFLLARSGAAAATEVRLALAAVGIDAAVTAAAAAVLLAPNITEVPIGEVWISDGVALNDALRLAGAREAERGANVLLRQAPGDPGLAFRDRERGVVNPIRAYLDLLNDPRRGLEQAEALRKAIDL